MHEPVSPIVALVVDDEYLIAVELESILEDAGYRVLSAVNVPEAREIADAHPVRVAVLDFRMGEAAVAFARELSARNVPIIFCTGSLPEEVAAVFPAVPVLPKPFAPELVRAVVAAAVAASVAPG